MKRLATFRPGDSGAAATEFALLAPVLVVLLLSTVDVAMAINQKMIMHHILRIGADAGMRGASSEEIADALETAAEANATSRMAALDVQAPSLQCLCADTVIACGGTCADGTGPGALYQFSATLPYESFFGGERFAIDLDAQLAIQVPTSSIGDDD
ncbi:TadE/TadG family type IV pilus assembly protein [Rhodosalinus sediminis]|uniref:TadE/TadG family type IV pilus assembly protein n=1 Tax=Rhodosalinus sediminis TaxID=1940533 RepID=UPI002355DB65|nr:TadE/TadG family type IV pilus assembly protein [Rhodosalinus sediminis]